LQRPVVGVEKGGGGLKTVVVGLNRRCGMGCKGQWWVSKKAVVGLKQVMVRLNRR